MRNCAYLARSIFVSVDPPSRDVISPLQSSPCIFSLYLRLSLPTIFVAIPPLFFSLAFLHLHALHSFWLSSQGFSHPPVWHFFAAPEVERDAIISLVFSILSKIWVNPHIWFYYGNCFYSPAHLAARKICRICEFWCLGDPLLRPVVDRHERGPGLGRHCWL